MKTKALRLYGADDIRLEEFELPEITAEEVLIRVVSDSLCASTYKAIKQGAAHKRVPPDIAENPVIIGHEMCGEIVEVGKALEGTWQPGQKIVIQPALKLPSVVYNMLPYIISLVVLAFTSKKSRAPKAAGITYDQGSR